MTDPKLLIVEDDPAIRHLMMRELAGMAGLEVVRHDDPFMEIMSMALGPRRAPRERRMWPTFKGEPEWKSKGRHQGAKEKARRLRQMKKQTEKLTGPELFHYLETAVRRGQGEPSGEEVRRMIEEEEHE